MESTFLNAPDKHVFATPPRVLLIGAGSRGTAYAEAVQSSTNAIIAAACEPNEYKLHAFGKKFIWGVDGCAKKGQAFTGWKEWVAYETERRELEKKGGLGDGKEVEEGIDAVFVCVLDELHEEVVCGIAGLGVHICCEKPMSTRLENCVRMYKALKANDDGASAELENGQTNGTTGKRDRVFGICHVLRYSPFNMLLRRLVRDENIIGDILSIEHTEPIGWWHASHSYVRYVLQYAAVALVPSQLINHRGNWRKESTTAPSLLTKSCHDIDFLMWMLCSPSSKDVNAPPHLPSYITSSGSRKFFRIERKPKAAGTATNCLSCAHEPNCLYSAKNIYIERHLNSGNVEWPVNVVNPEIEDIYKISGKEAAAERLLVNLAEDYTAATPKDQVEGRPWFGRCVWESDNDVCDDQCVTITWEDDPVETRDGQPVLEGRGAKSAQFHMIAFTEQQCERRGWIYGTEGEIEYDSRVIKVHNFARGQTKTYSPHMTGGGHGGGDEGLARQFLMGVSAVDSGAMSAADAQREYLGCDLEEAFRSHAVVFAADDARTKRQVVDWKKWWSEQVESQLHRR